MSDQLTISKEQVIAAASKCTAIKETLLELFPEAFKTNEIVPIITAISDPQIHQMAGDVAIHDSNGIENEPTWLIAIENNKICLSKWYKWEIDGRFLVPSHNEQYK